MFTRLQIEVLKSANMLFLICKQNITMIIYPGFENKINENQELLLNHLLNKLNKNCCKIFSKIIPIMLGKNIFA